MLYIKRNRKKAPPFMFLLALDKTIMNQKKGSFSFIFPFPKMAQYLLVVESKTNINYCPSSLQTIHGLYFYAYQVVTYM
jgi:hypothetical protein